MDSVTPGSESLADVVSPERWAARVRELNAEVERLREELAVERGEFERLRQENEILREQVDWLSGRDA